jgi:hypothetical protein
MANSGEDGRLTATQLGQAALITVEELTGYRPEAVTGLAWDGEAWCVTVDVLEMARIPSTTDMIGSYEVHLDERGTLREYRRVRRFKRCDARQEE